MSSSPYAPAAKLLNQIWTKRVSLKTAAYNRQGELTCSKSTYAQCAHVLQNKPLLDRILETVEVDFQAKNEGLLYVLLYELLLGPNQSIRGGGSLKRMLMKNEKELKLVLRQLKHEANSDDDGVDTLAQRKQGTDSVTIPRYVRVNTFKTTTSKIIQSLQNIGLNPIFLDPHIPDVLVLPPTAETRGKLQDMVSSNQIVLQDKASCFSALCLVHGYNHVNTEEEIAYLDACASPGNKTSHLAALVAQQSNTSNVSSTIHALDKSPDRYKLLQRRMKELVENSSAAVTLKCHNLDFFEVCSSGSVKDTHTNFQNIQAILLDPSCSGSGMTGNHLEAANEHRGDPEFCNDRVKSLAKFQLKALQHATSSKSFPNVKRVVYSTCSLYMEENECVIQRFLQAQSEADKETIDSWKVIAPKCLSSWKRRGLTFEGLSEAQANAMIRVHPDHDASNGFFVACLEKQLQAPSKKKSKNRQTSATEAFKGVTTASDLPFYNNEFDHSKGRQQEEKMPSALPSSPKPFTINSTTKRTKGNIEGSVPQPNKKQKISLTDAATESKEIDKEFSKLSKKRAKKLEWKRKQRERKAERLASKMADSN